MKSQPPIYQAGAVEVDITPSYGTPIGPRGLYCPVQTILEPLFARALVLESDGKRMCLVAMENRTVSKDWAARTRQLAAERFGLDPEAILIHAVQNHAAPRFGARMLSPDNPLIKPEFSWLLGGSEPYSQFVMEQILSAIELALDDMELVYLSVGSGLEERVAHNRRNVMRDGTSRTLGLTSGDPNILYAEGPIDPEVGVLLVTTEAGRAKALLLHHTCHPCHGNGGYCVTSGWPGAWSNQMKQALGEDCVPLVINGCCGNIHHISRRRRDPTHGDDYHLLGRMLAEVTLNTIQHGMTPVDDGALTWQAQDLGIPQRDLDPDKLEASRRLLEAHPEPMWKNEEHTSVDWEWIYAIAYLDLEKFKKRQPDYPYEIQVFRIGNIALVGLGGEPFVEGQLEIKLNSPAYRTFCINMANDTVGYIPTRRAFLRGGYETNTGDGSRLVPAALEMIVEATGEMLQEVFAD